MRKTSKLTVRVTDEEREELEQLAAGNGSSVSWHIQRAIAAWLSHQRTKEKSDAERR